MSPNRRYQYCIEVFDLMKEEQPDPTPFAKALHQCLLDQTTSNPEISLEDAYYFIWVCMGAYLTQTIKDQRGELPMTPPPVRKSFQDSWNAAHLFVEDYKALPTYSGRDRFDLCLKVYKWAEKEKHLPPLYMNALFQDLMSMVLDHDELQLTFEDALYFLSCCLGLNTLDKMEYLKYCQKDEQISHARLFSLTHSSDV